jgi:hypothetical protein
MLLAHRAWFEGLSARNQAVMRAAWGDPLDFRTRSRDYTVAEMAKRPAKGTPVIELTAAQPALGGRHRADASPVAGSIGPAGRGAVRRHPGGQGGVWSVEAV